MRRPSREDLVTSGMAQRHELKARVARGVAEVLDAITSLHEEKCKS